MGESANARQVGGAHYAGAYQHWDYVLDTKQGYLQGCASKYVSRHRRKNGREDLEKAMHYIDKAIEAHVLAIYKGANGMECFWRFVGSQELMLKEAAAVYYILQGQWEQARETVLDLINTSPNMDLASGGEQSGTGA